MNLNKIITDKDPAKCLYYELTPRRLAALDLIAYTEGTDRFIGGTKEGYNLIYGYRKFTPGKDHPRIMVRASGWTSSAAGRYQILDKTYDWLQTRLRQTGFKPFPSFEPIYQDQMGLYLIDAKRNALQYLDSGNIDKFLEVCSWEWASLPPPRYGQPHINVTECKKIYNQLLNLWVA